MLETVYEKIIEEKEIELAEKKLVELAVEKETESTQPEQPREEDTDSLQPSNEATSVVTISGSTTGTRQEPHKQKGLTLLGQDELQRRVAESIEKSKNAAAEADACCGNGCIVF